MSRRRSSASRRSPPSHCSATFSGCSRRRRAGASRRTTCLPNFKTTFNPEEARRQFQTVVDWGRYAELFTYDDTAGVLRLDEEHRVPLEPPGGIA